MRGDTSRQAIRLPSQTGAHGFRPYNLPVVIECPFCTARQRLDAARLGVDPNAHEHRMERRPLTLDKSERFLCCDEGRYRGAGCTAEVRYRMD